MNFSIDQLPPQLLVALTGGEVQATGELDKL
jgi:hypothetical protein